VILRTAMRWVQKALPYGIVGAVEKVPLEEKLKKPTPRNDSFLSCLGHKRLVQ
jgi:hypothetical protein